LKRTLVAAVLATIAFTIVRDTQDLEDTAFIAALVVSCAAAAIVAAALRIAAHTPWLTAALLAAVLVPVLYAAWIVVRLAACLVTGCDMA
jgi:hypothetical protein